MNIAQGSSYIRIKLENDLDIPIDNVVHVVPPLRRIGNIVSPIVDAGYLDIHDDPNLVTLCNRNTISIEAYDATNELVYSCEGFASHCNFGYARIQLSGAITKHKILAKPVGS